MRAQPLEGRKEGGREEIRGRTEIRGGVKNREISK